MSEAASLKIQRQPITNETDLVLIAIAQDRWQAEGLPYHWAHLSLAHGERFSSEGPAQIHLELSRRDSTGEQPKPIARAIGPELCDEYPCSGSNSSWRFPPWPTAVTGEELPDELSVCCQARQVHGTWEDASFWSTGSHCLHAQLHLQTLIG